MPDIPTTGDDPSVDAYLAAVAAGDRDAEQRHRAAFIAAVRHWMVTNQKSALAMYDLGVSPDSLHDAGVIHDERVYRVTYDLAREMTLHRTGPFTVKQVAEDYAITTDMARRIVEELWMDRKVVRHGEKQTTIGRNPTLWRVASPTTTAG